jgi:polysaccharide export outer membrane protein
VSSGEYRVTPPDAIAISATLADEIDGVVRQVRTDGKISLRLLGEVKVAGLTPKEIAAKLESMLSRYYVGAKVSVQVARYRSKTYYVFGQVSRPGAQAYTGRDTLLKALAAAHPTFLAWKSKIRVTRPSPEPGQQSQFIVDLDRMVQSGDTSQNVLLGEGDIVYVPPTPLAWMGLRLREVLYPIGPAVAVATDPAEIVNAPDEYRDDGESD